jgi:hypothetical protein
MINTETLIVRDSDFKTRGKPDLDNAKHEVIQYWEDAKIVIYMDHLNRPYVVKNKLGQTQDGSTYS